MTPRLARLADAAAIAANEAVAAHQPWSTDSIASTLSREDAFAVVVGDPVVGHLLATATLDEGELLSVAVSPACRRQGLARRLLHAAMEAWRARGVLLVHLEVRSTNDGAIALYEAEGFSEVGRRPRYYRDGTDALLFTRRTSPEP